MDNQNTKETQDNNDEKKPFVPKNFRWVLDELEKTLAIITEQWYFHAAMSNWVRHRLGHLSGESRGAMNFLNKSFCGKDKRKWGKLLRRA